MSSHHGLGGNRPTFLPKRDTELSFPNDRTVLLVIDPVNDFLSEGGAGWDLVKATVEKNDVITNLQRAIDTARSHGIPVLFGPMAYTREDYSNEQLQRRSGINRLMFEQKMFLAGTWGADFHPALRPRDDEIVLLPHKSIDVFETDLPDHLAHLGATHLVIAGMTANLCCESTGRHAMEAGYDVAFLSDAIGAAGLMAYEASIRVNYPLIANAVITVDEFVTAIDSVAEGALAREGDTVIGSDHGEIGTIDEVVMDSETGPGYVRVPRGLIFQEDTYIPLDAVVRRAGKRLFINIPKLLISELPWSEPPSGAEQITKVGPAEDEVDKVFRSRSPSGVTQSARASR
ncbi:MAG: isochorismatase family protein [Acidobacteria bacterium]|nr:isochorismatase family protein [Acidobacteriota bacterium]